MMNCSTVLVQNTWGMHLNFEGQFSSPPSCPSWLTQLQQQDWQRRGIVVWDADLRIVAHLYAGYALELLEHLQGHDAWKTNDLVIGSPAFQLSTSSAGNSSPKIEGTWIPENQIELRADQVQDLVEFLTAQESLLKRISLHDTEDAERALSKVYRLIAKSSGRKEKGQAHRDYKTEHPPHFHPTRQLFHRSSNRPDLSCHVKTDQSLDPRRQT